MPQLMRLLPMEIAARLSRPEAYCPHGNLRFVRCPAPAGAELMSWPPQMIEEGRPFSVKIGITAQTAPTSDELLVYLSYGVRRWLPSSGFLSSNHGHSVYLAPTVPYLSGLENSRHFGTARVRRSRFVGEDGEVAWGPQWDDSLASVLKEAGCLNRLPDPQQLVAAPMDYLQRTGDAAALVYRNGMVKGRKEKVSAGLSVGDRVPVMRWVAGELAPQLRQVDDLPREKCTVYQGLAGIAEGAFTPQRLRDVVGPRLTVELFTDNDTTIRYALDRLGHRFGTPISLGESTVTGGGLTVTVRKVATGALRADLTRTGRSTQAAVQERVDLIARQLRPATEPTVALVEIGHPDEYDGSARGDDPKFAIRHGLLETGRLSQFVTSVSQPYAAGSGADWERCSASVDELFRQLGFRPDPLPAPATGTLDRQPALLGLWMIRQNRGKTWGVQRQVPIAVLADPTGCNVQIRAPKVPWQPLHTGLIEVGKTYVNVDLKYGQDDTVRFVKNVIDEVTATFSDTLLLTLAQNLRGAWRTLANTQLQLDSLDFGGAKVPLKELPGLRHVRVRTVEGGETPECYGVNGDETGQPGGMWRYLVDRLYGSTTGKPVTQTSALKGVSKIVPGEHLGEPTTPRPQANVWNSQFVELFVAGLQHGDRPEHWAALAHDLRSAAPYVRDATTLPWPLHLAEQIEEYLLPTRLASASFV